MKKLFALLFALALCLSLCGCISEEAQACKDLIDAIGSVSADSLKEIVAAENAYDNLSTADKADIAKSAEILQKARAQYEQEYRSSKLEDLKEVTAECDFAALRVEAIDHPGYWNKHLWKSYKVTGYVEKLYEDRVEIIPIDAPIRDLIDPEISIIAYLSPEELKNLSEKDVINIAGEVSNISGSQDVHLSYGGIEADGLDWLILTMMDAVYVDNVIEFTGTVGFTVNYPVGEVIRIGRMNSSWSHANQLFYHDKTWNGWDSANSSKTSGTICGVRIVEGNEIRLIATDVTLDETIIQSQDPFEWSINRFTIGTIMSVEVLK